MIHDPEDVHHVLVRGHRNRKSRSYDGLRLFLGNGLITSEGAFWRRQRKLSQPAFHARRLEGLGEVMVGCAERALQRWERRLGTAPGPVDLHALMLELTLDVVGQTLFEVELAGESRRSARAVGGVLEYAAVHGGAHPATVLGADPGPSSMRWCTASSASVAGKRRLAPGDVAALEYTRSYLPFGAGPRVCIGNHFALMEATLILAMVLRRFQVDVVTDPEPRPLPRITVRPQGGRPARLTPRSEASLSSRAVGDDGRGDARGDSSRCTARR